MLITCLCEFYINCWNFYFSNFRFFLVFVDILYDHLDYTRPASSLKAHYQRMKSPFGSKEFVVDTKSETDD